MRGVNVFGIIAPIVTGYSISWTGGYNLAFIIGGAPLVVGALLTSTVNRSPIGAAEVSPLLATIAE